MKYATLLLGVAILIASITAAAAKVDRACIRDAREIFGTAQAKRICDPKNRVKPNQLGWFCELSDSEGPKFYKAKGGAASAMPSANETRRPGSRLRPARRRWRACYAGAGQGYGSSSTSSTAAMSSTATPAGSAARASCRSAWARRMSAAARGTGSSSRTRRRQR